MRRLKVLVLVDAHSQKGKVNELINGLGKNVEVHNSLVTLTPRLKKYEKEVVLVFSDGLMFLESTSWIRNYLEIPVVLIFTNRRAFLALPFSNTRKLSSVSGYQDSGQLRRKLYREYRDFKRNLAKGKVKPTI